MAQIGEPQRVITVHPVYSPVPGPDQLPDSQPVSIPQEPDKVEVPDGNVSLEQ